MGAAAKVRQAEDLVVTQWGWPLFEAAFLRFGKLRAKVATIVAHRDRLMQKVKADFDDEVSTPQAEADALQEQLETFLQLHKDAFGVERARFRDLPGGRVGFRRGPQKVVAEEGVAWEDVLAAMQANRKRYGAYLCVRESVDKGELASAPDEVLEALGLARVREDRPFLDWQASGGVAAVESES